MDKKTSKLAIASLIVFAVSIIGIVITLLIYRCGVDGSSWCGRSIEVVGYLSGFISFPLFYAIIALAIISLFLILIKRHRLKGLAYPLIVLILTTTVWIYPPLNPAQFFNKCPDLEKAIFFEFPHYGDKSLNPDDREGPEGCVVNFYSSDTSDQIADYYRGQLQNRGWGIKEDKSSARDDTPHVGFLAQSYILAEREGFLYSVSANQSLSGKTTEIRIGIQKMK